jgi:hypothetical protein
MQKKLFLSFLLIEDTFTLFFKDKKSPKEIEIEIKVFSTILA